MTMLSRPLFRISFSPSISTCFLSSKLPWEKENDYNHTYRQILTEGTSPTPLNRFSVFRFAQNMARAEMSEFSSP